MARHVMIRVLAVTFLVLIAALVYALRRQGFPLWGAYLLSIGVMTFLCYGFDKLQAKSDRTRMPEAVLHLFALAGGTPGAFLGQRVFRHKTIKRSFRRVFWAIVVLQVLVLIAFLILRERME